MRDQVHPQLAALDPDVLAAAAIEALDIALRSSGKAKRQFAASWQCQSAGACLGTFCFDKLFALGAGDAVAAEPDDAMDALAVDHHADRVAEVVTGETHDRNAVLGEFFPRPQFADGRAGQFGKT
jgi:hypothetical protein